MKGGIGSEDIRTKSVTAANLADGAVTAEKINASLKSNAINNLSSGAELSDVINAVNAILAALRKAGLVANSQ